MQEHQERNHQHCRYIFFFYLSSISPHDMSLASVEDGNALADTFIDYGVKMRDQNDLEILSMW